MKKDLKDVTEDIMGNDEHKEGPIAKKIENQTAKIPSDVFLWAAVGAMATSLGLKIAGRKHEALFVGQWAAPFLLFGIYNKIVKIAGSDSEEDDDFANGSAVL